MDPQEKRELRQLKREIKRAGGKRRRRHWKRDLIENPEEAHRTEEYLGRYRSSEFNGLDRLPTRPRPRSED